MTTFTTNTTNNANVNTPPQNEGYLKQFIGKLGTVFGNRSVQILSGGTFLGSVLGQIGGGAAVDTLVHAICAKCIGGVTGKVVASIAAPAVTNYLGKTVIVLGGASGAVTTLTLYFAASGLYYIVENAKSKLSGSADADASIKLDASQEEQTEIGDFTVLTKI
jgi:hypothetical protein